MFNAITKAFAKVLGTKSQRDLKKILPLVEKINHEWNTLRSISDDALRGKSTELQNYIGQQLKSVDDQIAALQQQIEQDNYQLSVNEKEQIFNQIDQLEVQRNTRLEEVLMDVLPMAFAVVKETAFRLKENKFLRVTATMLDRQLAAEKSHIVIEGDQAIWKNQWMAAGNEITWDMLHYDVQLIGGIVLHQGKISEMATGEGKTLVATLPAYLNALAKRGVHIVTVNDYLSRRDSEWMGPLFEFHGLTIDCIDKHEPNSEARRKAYRADITYGTNNEFGFDYLRDNMARDTEEIVQRRHHYAMVDEVDSVLIDDARTPLIISGPIPRGDEHEFYELKPRVQRLVEAQKKIVNDLLNDAKKKIKDGNEKEGGLSLFRAFRGLPKNKPLIKFLSEPGMKVLMQKTENIYLQDNAKLMPEADKPLLFTIDEKHNQIELTEQGIDFITGTGEDKQFFMLPDIGLELAKLEEDASLSHEEKMARKEELTQSYTAKAQRIHSINQLLKAYTLFENGVDYIIMEGKVLIVDEQTGRIMDGRRYSDGLHQALEAKENVKVEDATQTYATVTLQNYFRMYHKLAGMTGTAETEAGEFWEIYKLDVVVIPTNVSIVRKDQNDLIYKTTREKFNAVVEEIVHLTEQGRPVLVGTTSVENSELLSRMLSIRKIKHQVLNAKLHQKEAEIVAEAGKPGTVTIATNMAGRGTDIKLTPESKAAGGLAIIGTERHESRRVDRQLRGRSGRQGDPGSSQFFVSLEDTLMRLFGSDNIAKWMDRMGLKEGDVIQHSLITRSIERAQKKVEENNFSNRKNLLEYDDVMNSQREIIYKRRRNALYGDRLELDILNILYSTCESLVEGYQGAQGDFEQFEFTIFSTFGIDPPYNAEVFNQEKPERLVNLLYQAILAHYQEKNSRVAQKAMPILKDIYQNRGAVIEEVIIPFADAKRQVSVPVNLKKAIESEGRELVKALEKIVSLSVIDQEWKEHLRDMDDLRQSVRMVVHEQKDPLMVYKFEAFELFTLFVSRVNQDTLSFLMRADLPAVEQEDVQEARKMRREKAKVKTSKAEAKSLLEGGAGAVFDTAEVSQEKVMPVKSQKIADRNARVTVQYTDGTIKKDVKFKVVEEDLRNNKCVLVENK